MAQVPLRPLSRHDFNIAIICALPIEADLVESVFDEFWDDSDKVAGDPNAYSTGTIGQHNVVLAHMPGKGISSSASVAASLRTSYQGIKMAFVVGICGAVPKHPQTEEEILLGDCIISTAMVQYDFGRKCPEGFIRRQNVEDNLGRASMEIRSLTQMLQTLHNRQLLTDRLRRHLQMILDKRSDVSYPGWQRDRLFEPTYNHKHRGGNTCDACIEIAGICTKDCDSIGCGDDRLIKRQRLQPPKGAIDALPMIYFGRFGSASTVMRSGLDRDRAAKQGRLLAFEMEGSGVWDSFPTVVIKSACDYADSHKNKEWQPYAAATAAAGLKALLEFIPGNQIQRTELVHNDVPILNHSNRIELPPQVGILYRRIITSVTPIGDADQSRIYSVQQKKTRVRSFGCWFPTSAWNLLLLVIVLLTGVQLIHEYGITNHSSGHIWRQSSKSSRSRLNEEVSIGKPDLKEAILSPTERHYTMPLLQNQRFVGRGRKLAELENSLFVSENTRQLAVFGLGGMGKTQLALEFGYTIKARYPDYSIFWVSALSTTRLEEDYGRIAKAYSLPVGANDVVPLVQNFLSSNAAGKWLLIVDNADDKATLFEDDGSIVSKLPQSQVGVTLFTTRYKDVAFDLAGGHIIKLEEMDSKEAQLFLTASLVDPSLIMDEKAVNELLEQLTYLPLAIVQASSYIIKNSITIASYLSLLKGTPDRMTKLLSHEFRDSTRDTEAKNAVALTWLLSFEQIKKQLPEALDILFFMASIENKSIPISILPLPDPKATEIIGILIGYSFLSKSGDGETYDMHSLVHRAVNIWMQDQGITGLWMEKVATHLYANSPLITCDLMKCWIPQDLSSRALFSICAARYLGWSDWKVIQVNR